MNHSAHSEIAFLELSFLETQFSTNNNKNCVCVRNGLPGVPVIRKSCVSIAAV